MTIVFKSALSNKPPKSKNDSEVGGVILILFILLCSMNLAIFHIGDISSTVPVASKEKYPAIVWYTDQIIDIEPTLTCYKGNPRNYSKVFNCNVYPIKAAPDDPEAYVFDGMLIDKVPLPRDPKTIWGLSFNESPKLKPVLMLEKALNLFNFSSTFSRGSDVPQLFTFVLDTDLSSTHYFVSTAMKNQALGNLAPVVFVQENCGALTERELYVRELQKYIDVDSYGKCLHNKNFPPEVQAENNSTFYYFGIEFNYFIAKYKFIIAIENAVCVDYVTEKFWRAIELGVVPIYYGSPLIRDWLPNNKSAILLEDFPTPQLLSEHLHYLLNNDTAYEEYLEHKTLGLISNQKLFETPEAEFSGSGEGTEVNLFCLICARIHDRDSTRVNIVTKKHFDCPTPKSALTLSVNQKNAWLEIISDCNQRLDDLYKEIDDTNSTRRTSVTGLENGRDPSYVGDISCLS